MTGEQKPLGVTDNISWRVWRNGWRISAITKRNRLHAEYK